MLRSRRLHRFVLPATLLPAALLAGCATPAPAGDPFPDPPRASLWEILGLDAGPDADALDKAFAERIAAAAEESATFSEQVDAELARAIRDARTGGTKPAAFAITPVTASGTPGVDLPVVTERGTTTTGTSGGRPTVITSNSSSTIRDQREVTVHENIGTTGEPEVGRGSIESVTSTTTAEPCVAPGEPAGEFEVVVSRRIVEGGAMVDVTITSSGTVVPEADGTISLRDVRVEMGGEGVGADGTTVKGVEFTVDADLAGWDGDGELSDTRGTWNAKTPPDVGEKDAITLAGAQLDAFRGLASDAVRRAEELRERQGLCVRIVVDTHGENTLADGDEARFDARVIDPKTGEEIPDAVVEAVTSEGSVSPASATGHGTFAFTASGDPDYRVRLTTETPRGGHTAYVRYGAPGWKFEGVTYGYTLEGSGIPVEITWEGRVCGDFRGPWQFNWQLRSAPASPSSTGTYAPTEASDVTRGDRAILVYEEVPNPADGEPPFRLWIDDENHGKIPVQQRIEVHPEPIEGPCTET